MGDPRDTLFLSDKTAATAASCGKSLLWFELGTPSLRIEGADWLQHTSSYSAAAAEIHPATAAHTTTPARPWARAWLLRWDCCFSAPAVIVGHSGGSSLVQERQLGCQAAGAALVQDMRGSRHRGPQAKRSSRTLIVRPSIWLLFNLSHAVAASSLVVKRTVPKPL